MVNWEIAATTAAPVVALFVGSALDRKLERRPRLISFLSHATAVRVNPPEGPPFNINSHSVVARNAGHLSATNVRLGRNHLPTDFSVWPAAEHGVRGREDDTAEIVFPTLVPNEQIVVTYLYVSTISFNQINSYTKCNQGYAHVVTALTAPMQKPWIKGVIPGGAGRYDASRVIDQSNLRWHNMNFSDLERAALQLNELYEELETKRWGRVWTIGELALGFVGDVGDLAKLVQAHAGVRDIDDCKAKLGHELSDCLWSIIVLANKCGIDLQTEFTKNTEELVAYVSGELGK
jgi:NTP pyrophosphatase (non-canonical NTP hydrolase)